MWSLKTRSIFSSSVTSSSPASISTVSDAARRAATHRSTMWYWGGGGGVLKEFAGPHSSALQNQASPARSCTPELIIWTVWIVCPCCAVRLLWRLLQSERSQREKESSPLWLITMGAESSVQRDGKSLEDPSASAEASAGELSAGVKVLQEEDSKVLTPFKPVDVVW